MFSLPKLLVLAGIVVAVLYGYKLYTRFEQRLGAAKRRDAPQQERPKQRVEAQDLEKCPACGTYIAAGAKHDCADRR